MYIVNIVNTERKHISIDNNIDIDISIDNSLAWQRFSVVKQCKRDWMQGV